MHKENKYILVGMKEAFTDPGWSIESDLISASRIIKWSWNLIRLSYSIRK